MDDPDPQAPLLPWPGEPGKRYAGLLDVAGEEEEGSSPEAFDNMSRRDSTALTARLEEIEWRDRTAHRSGPTGA
jgi:hypothetical protein